MRIAAISLVIFSLFGPAAAQTKTPPSGKAKQDVQKVQPPAKPEVKKDEANSSADDKNSDAQGEGSEGRHPRDPMSAPTFNGLRMRLVGPAVISGRVVAFAINPKNRAEFYAAAASGGLW